MKEIDCLFIGHNEMDFARYEKKVREMGVKSGAFRDLNLNFVTINGTPYTVSGVFNLIAVNDDHLSSRISPLTFRETFSASISYLGTYLDCRGLTFDYINSFHDEKDVLAEKLKKENILIIAIITTLYVSVFPIFEIMDFIRKHNRTVKVVIGGPFISNQIRVLGDEDLHYLFNSINANFFVHSAQGEETLVHLIKTLKADFPLKDISNIYYKVDGNYIHNPIRFENNILSENMVNWDLFADQRIEYVNVRTSISCPYSCSFCGFPQHAGKYQTAPVSAVEKELNRLDRLGTVKSVQFIDDTFNIPVKRFKHLLRLMIKNRYSFKWHSHLRCQFAEREMVELMKESGCEGVFLGIESGNNQILENMNKAATVEKYLEGISLLKEYGILTYGSFIIGFPGETYETVQDTVSFITNSGIDFYRAQLWYCDTITPIWRERETYQIKGSRFEWSHATMDSRTACNLIDEIFLSIDDPVWVPQYHFESDGIFHLLHRGISLEKCKNFLKSFNRGIREKLLNPDHNLDNNDVSLAVLKELKSSFEDENNPNGNISEPAKLGTDTDTIDKYGASFEF
jgi:anaerobic magnesium-protoporphyrin IX monomethyl ester cyclase